MLIEFILNTLTHHGAFTMDFIDAMTSGYCASYRKLKKMGNPFYREIYKDWDDKKKLSVEEYQKLQRQRFYNLLSYLQRRGLVEKKKIGNQRLARWQITNNGRSYFKNQEEKKTIKIPFIKYKREPSKSLKIVIFDIPEKERQKRYWLRQVLVNLDFQRLQKSVWIGKNKIPEELIYDLKNFGIFTYVEIFSISEIGTICYSKAKP